MNKRLLIAAALVGLFSLSFADPTRYNGRVTVTARPIPGMSAPSIAPPIFPTSLGNPAPMDSFHTAGTSVLWDMSSLVGYYFPQEGIVLDDAAINNDAHDCDGDSLYFIDHCEFAVYWPTGGDLNADYYLVPPDANLDPDFANGWVVELTVPGLTPGGWIISFDVDPPLDVQTIDVTYGSDPTVYDYCYVGVDFPDSSCTTSGIPGLYLANGPDYSGDFFWWEGNACGYGTGYYWFGGNPAANFGLLIEGDCEGGCTPGEGDTNGDGCVDDADLANLIFDFGGPESGANGFTDQDCNGIVDDADFAIAVFNFGNGCF